MADVFEIWYNQLLVPWEGGIANRPLSADPGGLTNRGVTIATWKKYAPLLFGIPGTESTLLKITAEQAKRIAKEVYWNFYAIDTITNPAIQLLVAESVWGGGGYPSLGYPNGTNLQRAAQINADNAKNKNLFYTMLSKREAYLRSLPNAGANPGWFTRTLGGDKYGKLGLKDLVERYGLNTVTTVAIGATLVALAGVYLVVRAILMNNQSKKQRAMAA